MKKCKLQDTLPEDVQRTKRQKWSSLTAGLFATACFKYNVGQRKRKDKSEVPHKVTLQSAALKHKLAAIKSNDEPRIIQFNARDTSSKCLQYLMELEIRTYDDCYTEYVCCLQKKPKDQNLSSPADVTGGFGVVGKFINDNIFHCYNAVSMVKLHDLYKTGVDNVNARVYRSKLKDRIKSELGNQLLFLTINSTTPQAVVSSERINSNTIFKDKEEIIKKCAK